MGNLGSQPSGAPRVRVRAMTYTKDSYGLFDFQKKDCYKEEIFELTRPAVLVRKEAPTPDSKKDFRVLPLKQPASRSDAFNLLQLEVAAEKASISRLPFQFADMDAFDEEKARELENFHERFIWRVCSTGSLKLQPGVVFRLGRLRFRVRESSDGVKEESIGVGMNLGHKEVYKPQEDEEEVQGTEMHCRICLESESTEKAFANICACTRSNPMHAECLMDWIKARMTQRKMDYFRFYSWKLLDCDLCKKPFPESFTCSGKKYNLLSYEKPEKGAYLVVDLFNKEEEHHPRLLRDPETPQARCSEDREGPLMRNKAL